MKKLLYYNCLNYNDKNLSLLKKHFQLTILDNPKQDNIEILKEVEILSAPLGFNCDKNKIEIMPKLEIIFSNTTGHPHIDVEFAKHLGISVITLKDHKNFLEKITPTAEHAWWLIQSLTRPYDQARKSVLSYIWDRKPFAGKAMLSKKVIGIIGLGRLGSKIANYAKAFGMDVIFYDPYVTNFSDYLKKCQNLEELFMLADIITLHVPHEKNTDKLISESIIFKAKKKPIFVNTSRAEIVDNEALLKAYKMDVISGIGIDVFDNEYDVQINKRLKESQIINLAKNENNIIITPHIGGSTLDAWDLTQEFTINLILKKCSN